MNRKKAITLAAVGTLAAVNGYAVYTWFPRREKPISSKRRIVCIGDSITFGAGVAKSRKRDAWTYILERALGDDFQVLNYGVSGATAQNSGDYPYRRHGYMKEAIAADPEMYILMLGTNDSKSFNWNREGFDAAMRGMVDELRESRPSARILLMLPPRAFVGRKGIIGFGIQDDVIRGEVIPILRNIAADYGLRTIDLYALTEGHPEYFGDGIHPNVLGNRVIADYIRGYM